MSVNPAQVVDSAQVGLSHQYSFTGNDYTIERKHGFIQALIDTHTVYRAAQIAGISKKTAYLWAEADPQFSEAWQEALESSTEELESCMYERAKDKDTLAGIFLLKKYNPEFRDKLQIDVRAVQDDIDELMGKLNQKQLPGAMTEFIDTDYSTSQSEYQPIEPASQLEQKEDSES